MPAAARTASQASLSDSETPRANAAGGGGGGSNKQNPWTKMAVQQHQLASGGGLRSPVLGSGGAGAANGRSRSVKADAATDIEATVAARRAGRSLNARFGDYAGDLFGQRGDYASSILYLSRMPVAGADEVQLTGPLANRRSSAAGSPAAGGSLRRSSVIAQGEAAYSSSAGAVLASMQLAQQAQQLAAQGGGGGGAAASLAGGAAPAAGSGAAAVAAARQQHGGGGGAGTVTFADGKSQAASLARSGAASTVAPGIASGSGSDEAGESADAEFRGVEGDDEEGGPGPRVQLLDAEAIVTALSRGAHASTGFTLQLLDSAATSRGSAGGGLRRLGLDDEEKEGDGAIAPVRLSLRQQCALALREMSRDPASRTAIIDQGGFRALLAVLLESEAGAEAEAEALADIVAHKSERAASIYGAGPDEPSRSVWAAKSAPGGPGSVRSSQGGGSDPSTPAAVPVSQHAGRSLVRRGVGTQTVLLRPEGGYAAAAAGYPTAGSTHIEGCLVDAPIELRFMAGTQAVGGSGGAAADAEGPQSLGDSDEGGSTLPGGGVDTPAASASESLSRQPLTDTLFNCLAAICNLSAVPPADVRAAYDVPLPPPAPAAELGAAPHDSQQQGRLPEPPPPLEPGLVALLVTLSPSVVGAARCLLLTTLFNFSTHRPHRERLVEEGGVAGVLALMAPELQHMRGNAPVRVSDEEAAAFAAQAAQRGGTGMQRTASFRSSTQQGGAASSLYAEPMDVFGTAVAAASVAVGTGAAAAAAGAVPRWTGAGRGDSQTPSRVAKPRSRGGARTTAVLIPQGVEPSAASSPAAAAAAAEDEYAEEEWDDDLGSPSKGSAAAVPQPMGPGGRSHLDGEVGKADDADADAEEGDGASADGGSTEDEDADLLAAVNDLHSRGGGRQWAGSTAGGNVRRRMQLLLRRLQRSQTAGQRRTSQVDLSMLAATASASPAGEGSAQQRWGIPGDSAADASLLLEDAYCLQVGVKLLCNLSGCPAGIDSMLELSSIQVRIGGRGTDVPPLAPP